MGEGAPLGWLVGRARPGWRQWAEGLSFPPFPLLVGVHDADQIGDRGSLSGGPMASWWTRPWDLLVGGAGLRPLKNF